MAHYDYWSDSLKRSILLDSGADLISYGMGERSIIEIADALASGLSVHDLSFIDGTVYKARSLDHLPDDAVVLPSFEAMQSDSRKYATSFAIQHENLDPFSAHILVEEYPHDVFVVQNPPSKPLSMSEMDAVYALPFARDAHPLVCASRWRACAFRGEVLAHEQSRLHGRLLVLRAQLPPGPHHPGA